jgi:hypothetical protein
LVLIQRLFMEMCSASFESFYHGRKEP